MNKYITTGFLLLLIVSANFLNAKEIKLKQPIPQNFVYQDYFVAQYKPIKNKNQSEIETLIFYYADKYNVDGLTMLKVAKCESGFNPLAIGDGGKSIGLFQIHLPSHPEIIKQETLNPIFSIEWTAKEFSKGNQWKWSCWKQLNKKLNKEFIAH